MIIQAKAFHFLQTAVWLPLVQKRMTGMGVILATHVFTRGMGAVGVNLEVTSTARRRMIGQVTASHSPQTAP